MTLRGSVQDFPLRAVLELLAQTKKTGELQLRAGDRVGAFGVAGGRIVTAVLGEEEDPLLALRELFAFDAGEFEFTPWDDSPPGNLEGTVDELLRKADEAHKRREAEREAARRKAEEERKKAEAEAEAERKRLEEIRTLIPSDDVPLRLSERAVEQGAVTLTSERWRLVLAVNGMHNVNEIAAILHMDHNATLTSLASLVRDGVIEMVPGVAPAHETPATSAPSFEPAAPTFEPAAPAYEPSEAFAADREAPQTFGTEPAAAPEIPAAPPDWITPDRAAPAPDWTPAADPAPISEVAPQWAPTPETNASADWIRPATSEPPPADDRLGSLSGIFGPAPTEPHAPAEPSGNAWAPPPASEQWGTPTQPAPGAERWSAPRAGEAERPAGSDDPWRSPPSSAPSQDSWTPPAPAPATEKAWASPASSPSTWSPPAAGTTSADPWGATGDPRAAALGITEPTTPPVEEWGPPSAAGTEKKKRGLFGFGREKPAPPPVAGVPLPTAGVVGSRVGMLAALSNALIAEYNNGQYGKGRIEERIANLLMRVDEQADPIDRPLPIVDDRIDVESLEREHLAESQALPYLALLVTTIFADAEKTFGKDKAKKGYRAAQKSVLLGDASALSTPELAGKLPRV